MPAPIQISDADWAELQRVLAQALPQAKVWAFGSRARFNTKPYSNLDIAIDAPTPLALDVLAALNDALDQSDLCIRVDVVDLASASNLFRKVIEEKMVPIWPEIKGFDLSTGC